MRFPDTQWSLIRASGGTPSERRVAFDVLVRAYRPAIVAYFAARLDRTLAEDAAQSFLTSSFEGAWWSRADAALGSFRGFLLILLRRHLGHLRSKGSDASRQGDVEDLADESPGADRQFDARFALVLTACAVERLRADYTKRGRAALIDSLLPLLSAPPAYGEGREIAEKIGLPPNTLVVETKRLRARLREALRHELRDLCADDAVFEREWAGLRDVLGG